MTDSPATPPPDVDSGLLEGIRVGDEASIAAFDRRFRGRLHRAAQRRGMDPAGAEDVVQETLLAAIRQIAEHKFQERVPVGVWVWRIFERRLADRARRDIRRNATFIPIGTGEPAAALARGAAPDASLHVHDLRRRVRRIFSMLTPRERMVLLMNVHGDVPAREIARIMKLGQKATEAALTAAKKKFARLWRESQESE